MSGEAQYINPIIQAMLSRAQMGQNAVKMQQQKDQAKAELELRQHLGDLEEQRIKNEHDFQTESLKNSHALLLANLAQQQNQQRKDVADMVMKLGVDPSKLYPAGTPQPTGESEEAPGIVGGIPKTEPTIQIPGVDQPVPVSAFSSPEKWAKFQADQAGRVITAQKQAEEPFEIAKSQRDREAKLAENKQNADAAMLRVIAQGANAERIAKIHGAYSLANEREATAGRLAVAKYTHGLGMDDQNYAIAEQLEDGVLNATRPYPTDPVQRRAVEQIAHDKGHVLVTDKNYAATLQGAQESQKMLDQARDLANNYSSDSSGYTGLGSGVFNAMKGMYPGSDLRSNMDSLKAQANVAAKGVGINRTSNQEMNRLFEGVFDPTRTRQQNLDNVEKLARTLNTQIDAQFPKNIPAFQKNLVLKNRGISDFGDFKDKPNSGAPGSPVTIKNKADYDALPAGSHFIDPGDGQTYIK